MSVNYEKITRGDGKNIVELKSCNGYTSFYVDIACKCNNLCVYCTQSDTTGNLEIKIT